MLYKNKLQLSKRESPLNSFYAFEMHPYYSFACFKYKPIVYVDPSCSSSKMRYKSYKQLDIHVLGKNKTYFYPK